ncbi:MAG: tetraacyldisaccharide 4'-kinase [Candidatus Omnitrophica bacterium]|nr:tetraacyldisaccharide 4'-kinase [Candidatus Omnitrophota bacterium]
MTDRKRGAVAAFLKFILWLCSLVYGRIVKILSRGYEKKFFVPYKADPKVISIGNITVGGTGKTQATIAIGKILESWGKRVSILIRGYGADEYMMLREELRECPVLVGPDRIENSKRAFYDFGVDTVILDDGFQYWKIKRDLDIILLDATNPFGNYKLLPRGILREPPAALRRADLIIVTKADSASLRQKEIYSVITDLGKADCVLEAIYKPQDLYEISKGQRMGLNFVKNKRICLVSSIANPTYFKEKLIELGAIVEIEFIFLDHYNYRKEDVDRIERECKFFGIDAIVITKKDAVKLKRFALATEQEIPVLVLAVEFEIIKNKSRLYERLSGIYSS